MIGCGEPAVITFKHRENLIGICPSCRNEPPVKFEIASR